MSPSAEKELYDMVKAIYVHLGLDGKRPESIHDIQDQAKRDVLIFMEKKRKWIHDLKTCPAEAIINTKRIAEDGRIHTKYVD